MLAEPRESLFEPAAPGPYDAEAVRAAVERRGTTPVALRFDAPDVVEDQLWPQLRKSLGSLTGALDRQGFDVLRSAAFTSGGDSAADDRNGTDEAVFLLELAVTERPAIERHEGPPVHVREHASGFSEAYADDPDVAGPYIADDRYVVERPREYRSALNFLSSDAVFDVSLGPHVASELEAGYDVLVGAEIAALTDTFGVDLARYFDPKP